MTEEKEAINIKQIHNSQYKLSIEDNKDDIYNLQITINSMSYPFVNYFIFCLYLDYMILNQSLLFLNYFKIMNQLLIIIQKNLI